jgi:hypothetical protein
VYRFHAWGFAAPGTMLSGWMNLISELEYILAL